MTEWLGVAAVVAVLAAGVAGGAARVAEAVGTTLCGVVGGTCEARAASPEPDLAPGPFDDVPGTRDERDRVSTPRPPGGDQCSSSPDAVGSLYDFSYACYGHDICWQLGTLGGATTTYAQCNARFLDAMRAHCDRRHGSSARAGRCRAAARTYWAAVTAAAVVEARRDCPADPRLDRCVPVGR
jgi:hypothetical protein